MTTGKVGFTRGKEAQPIAQFFSTGGNKLVAYTVTLDYSDRPDHEVVHKSMAPNWIKALDMALRAQCSNPEFNVEVVPARIRIERK